MLVRHQIRMQLTGAHTWEAVVKYAKNKSQFGLKRRVQRW